MTLRGGGVVSSLGQEDDASQDTSGLVGLASPERDAPFRPAERLDRESAWFGHMPFAYWLVRAAPPRLFVELGTQAESSYAAFCQAVVAEGLATHCYVVDTWEGDEHADSVPDEVFTDLAAYHDCRFTGSSQMLRCTFDEACRVFCDCSIDLHHIKGLKTSEAAADTMLDVGKCRGDYSVPVRPAR
jgi:hypothetical protein